MWTNRAAPLLAFLALAPIAASDEGPAFSITPPDSESGLRASIASIYSKTDIVFDTPGAAPTRTEHEIVVTLLLEADGRCPALFVADSRLTAALDERESDSVRSTTTATPAPASARRDLERWFVERLFSSGAPVAAPSLAIRAPGLAPRQLVSLRGCADVVVASCLAARAIEPKAMAEKLPVVPGVTLLVTRFDADEDGFTVAYEARIDRRRAGARGIDEGLEPVFAGIGLRDAGGRLLQLIRAGESMDTRDESIRVAAETRMTKELFRQTASFEALVFVGLRKIRVEFEGRNLRLAAP